MYSRALVSALVVFAFVGCAGMTVTTTSTGLDGKTTVRSSDPAEQARIDAKERDKEAYAKAIAEAPRRSPQDPIQVAVFETTVAEALSKALDRKQLDESLRRELSADPLLRIVPVTGLTGSAARIGASDEDRIAAAREKGISPDVWVMPHVMLEDAVGSSGGRLVSVKAFTLLSGVVSAYGTGATQSKEQGTVFQNAQVVRNAAMSIRAAVVGGLGPNLPDHEAVAALQEERRRKAADTIAEQAGILPEDDTATRMRKLMDLAKQPKQPAQSSAQE
ncbi:hypothetical protein HUA75_10290 [Myxococcus sp. CA040A]|uniref:Lipoprotein n=2 Tax=Myxococcaceae TaxID=31 RepID=A0A540WWY3_9BACT|nr:hypothetical protein [Myxococcus sp. CA040A]TQF12944.1 hypothetical protein FJV41_26405 [Myxococcus llanfairpwllgwyngyllgogerychwyrndrobwllllantysiliogogogochensis]